MVRAVKDMPFEHLTCALEFCLTWMGLGVITTAMVTVTTTSSLSTMTTIAMASTMAWVWIACWHFDGSVQQIWWNKRHTFSSSYVVTTDSPIEKRLVCWGHGGLLVSWHLLKGESEITKGDIAGSRRVYFRCCSRPARSEDKKVRKTKKAGKGPLLCIWFGNCQKHSNKSTVCQKPL